MASLHVTFSRARKQNEIKSGVDPNFPLAYGSDVRTELVTIGSVASTTLSASSTDHFIELYAEDDCWYKIGPSPQTATAITTGNNTSRFLAAGERREFDCDPGDIVSVIAPAA